MYGCLTRGSHRVRKLCSHPCFEGKRGQSGEGRRKDLAAGSGWWSGWSFHMVLQVNRRFTDFKVDLLTVNFDQEPVKTMKDCGWWSSGPFGAPK